MTPDNENEAAPRIPRLRIPEEYRSGFAKIIGLGDDSFRELLSTLEVERPALDYQELSSRIAPKIKSLSASDVRDIVETLVALYVIRSSWNLGMPEFAKAIRRAVETDEGLELPGEERDRFEERLALFLGLGSLDATSKALDVLLEHEHTLHDVRIMTDVRPVFGQNTEEPPTGAVIVHMLKIGYYAAEEIKELFVALDTGDIGVLSAELERANQKAESLKRLLKPTGVPYIDAG